MSRNHEGQTIEERIAALAARQHGVVTHAQLLAAGFTGRMVVGRLRAKRLNGLHRGVYQVGPVAAPRAREMAAVLASVGRGVVSHGTAAWIWEFGERPGEGSPVELRVPHGVRIRRPGLRVHRTTRLGPGEIRSVDGIPLTSPSRTLVDLAGCLTPRDLERALARADRLGLLTREELLACVGRHRRQAGVVVLEGLVAQDGGPALTRSTLEDRFRDEVVCYELPPPRFNVREAGYELDVWWAEARLAVELDGAAYHRSWRSQELDRQRDADLAAAGIALVRISWRQLVEQTKPTMRRVIQAFAIGRDRLARQ